MVQIYNIIKNILIIHKMVEIHNIIKSKFKIMFNTYKLSKKIIHINYRIIIFLLQNDLHFHYHQLEETQRERGRDRSTSDDSDATEAQAATHSELRIEFSN